MAAFNVGIVDDHLLFTKALTTLVNSTEKYNVVLAAASGAEFQSKLSAAKKLPHIILMDINLGDSDGVEETKWCKGHFSDIHVLALSMDGTKKTVLQMIRAGASGYLLKDVDPEQFILALDTVLEKGFYHSELVSSALLDKFQVEEKVPLKENEQIFLKHACSDKTYKEIADMMFLSPKTIDKYRESLFKKFQVKSRVALALFAIKKGYVEV